MGEMTRIQKLHDHPKTQVLFNVPSSYVIIDNEFKKFFSVIIEPIGGIPVDPNYHFFALREEYNLLKELEMKGRLKERGRGTENL